MKRILFFVLLLVSVTGYGQLMQTNGTAGGYQWVGFKSDSLHIIPRGSDTPNIGGTKYGKSTVGAMFYKTADSTLWIRSSNKWNQVTGTGGGSGSGITSLGQGYGVIIANDSTYNVDSSLFISVQHFYNTVDSIINIISNTGIDSIVVNSPLTIDFTNRQVPVISYTGDTTRYFVFESPIQANVYGDTVYVYLDTTLIHTFPYLETQFYPLNSNPAGYITYDSAQGKFVDTGYTRSDTVYLTKNGSEFPIAVIPASAGGGISEVIAGYGLLNINDSTLMFDSTILGDLLSGGDTTVFNDVIDSTGQPGQRVLFSGGDNHIKSDSYFLYDSVLNKLVINHNNISVGGTGIKLWVQGDTYLNGNLGLYAPVVKTDTSSYKPLVISPNPAGGSVFRLDRWPIVSDPSKVDYVVGGTGIRVDSSGRVYTVKVDTFLISTRAWRDKLADSLGALIALKGTGTVTSLTQGYGIINSTNPITTTGTQRIDTFAISTRAWRDKLADSLGVIIAGKEPVQSGTGYVKKSGTTTSYDAVIPIAGGGTNNGSLSVTAGTIYYGDGTKLVGIAPGTAAQHLTGGTTPAWKDTAIVAASSAWNLIGNSGTASATNFVGTTDNVSLRFRSNNIVGITLDSNQRVGIGTTTPAASAILDLTSTTGALVLPRMTASQQSSIGTPIAGDLIYNTTESAPTYYNGSLWSSIAPVLLKYGNNLNNIRGWNGGSVNSSANLVGSSGLTITAQDSVNMVIGFEAGNDMTSGYRNIFWGTYSGRKATTAFGNIGIGIRTMGGNSGATAMTTAKGNIAIGMSEAAGVAGPLGACTTCIYNVVVGGSGVNGAAGSVAGRNITSGQYNTLVGASAGAGLTTQSSNTFIGYLTGAGATTSGNTIIGSSFGNNGFQLTSGTLTAAGYSAGNAVSTGTGVAVGISAMATSSAGGSQTYTGSDNLAIGNYALTVVGSVSGNGPIAHARNTIVGMQSTGVNITTAVTDNVGLGYKALADNAAGGGTAVTGSQNIGIGSGASLMSLSGSGQLVIGSGNNATNRWLISDVSGSARRWVINGTTTDISSTTASAALEVRSTLGGFMPPVMTATQASAISSPADGNIIYVSSTDATFTSIGFWGRISGTWTALHL